MIISLTVLLMYPLVCFLLLNEKYFRSGFHVVRFQAKVVLFLCGIRKKVVLASQLPPPPYIICPNHSSYLDIFLTYSIFPDYFLFMGKKELGSIPVFNIYFKKMNILVDRRNVKLAHQAYMRAGEEVKNGNGIVLFPEGTISDSAPAMKGFKNGAFRLAIENQVPIIPVTYKNNYKLLEDSTSFGAKARPGKSLVYIHKPIYTKGMIEADLVNLRQDVRKIISSQLP